MGYTYNIAKVQKRIKDKQHNIHKSQEQMADKLKVSRNQYQRYVTGANQIPIDIIMELSVLFDVSPVWLLFDCVGEDQPKKEILNLLNLCTEAQLLAVLNFLRAFK